MKINKIFLGVATSIFLLSGCATLNHQNVALKDLKEKGCEAFNFDSLLLIKSNANVFLDERTDNERNYQNSLFTPYEYCQMSKLSLAQLLVKFGEKTNYRNIVNVNDDDFLSNEENISPIKIRISRSAYKYLDDYSKDFNFVATNGKQVIVFKNNEPIKINKSTYTFSNEKEYKDEKNQWLIKEIKDNNSTKILNLKTNYFFVEDYKIMF